MSRKLHELTEEEFAQVSGSFTSTDGVMVFQVNDTFYDKKDKDTSYDSDNLKDSVIDSNYQGAVETDRYGRKTPKAAHGVTKLAKQTSSSKCIIEAMMELYDRIVDPVLLVRRMYVVANHVVDERTWNEDEVPQQLDLFTDYEAESVKQQEEADALEKEKRQQKAILAIKQKYGKNAILKGANLTEGATARERNGQIGGHKA